MPSHEYGLRRSSAYTFDAVTIRRTNPHEIRTTSPLRSAGLHDANYELRMSVSTEQAPAALDRAVFEQHVEGFKESKPDISPQKSRVVLGLGGFVQVLGAGGGQSDL